MKILDYGHINPHYAHCSLCGATLEFDMRDVIKSNKCDACGPSYDRWVNCPVCGVAIYEHEWRKCKEDLFLI
jgi:predicted nucleic acid-binding Zn ribbon protein